MLAPSPTAGRRLATRRESDELRAEFFLHSFAKKSTFRRPQHCHLCGDSFFGAGVRCTGCKFVAHPGCQPKVVLPCFCSPGIPSVMHAHQWLLQPTPDRCFCNVCRAKITGGKGALVCLGCGAFAHRRCRERSAHTCRALASYAPSSAAPFAAAAAAAAAAAPELHKWVEGNLATHDVCAACQKSCHKPLLFGVRCATCHTTAHPACVAQLPRECGPSPFAALVLPARAIVPAVDPSSGIGLGVASSDQDDGAGGDEQDVSDVVDVDGGDFDAGAGARRSTLAGPGPRTGGDKPVLLRIFAGSVLDPDAADVSVVRAEVNMSAAVVVELALSGFGIYRPTLLENYYLQEVCYAASAATALLASTANVTAEATVREGTWQCGACKFFNTNKDLCCSLCHRPNGPAVSSLRLAEREVEGSERAGALVGGDMTTSDGQTGVRVLFLRSRDHDAAVIGGASVVRLYMDEAVCPGMPFKTVKLTKDMTTEALVALGRSKFGVDELVAGPLVLQALDLRRGAIRRHTLRPADCPYDHLQAFLKTCINDQLLQFIIRSQATLTPMQLFVRHLPVHMSAADMTATLEQLLAHVGGHFTVTLVVRQAGVALIACDSEAVAVRVATILRLSNVMPEQPLQVGVVPEVRADALTAGESPLLVLCNGKSGGGQGAAIYSRLAVLLNKHQVYDITVLGPYIGLLAFRALPHFRVLVVGGDGTVGWVLNSLRDVSSVMACPMPAVGLLPVGTGNDLARVLNWGPGYNGEKIPGLLHSISEAAPVPCDRWTVAFSSNHPDHPDGRNVSTTMTNYFGIGLDAQIALEFHNAREANPAKFTSRMGNKREYMRQGMAAFMKQPCKHINKDMVVIADGRKLLLPDVQGLVVLNIASWGAGANPWGTSKDESFSVPSMSDGLFELVAFYGVLHMTHVSTHLRAAKRIGQFRRLDIRTSSALPVQVDGEPWSQPPGFISISAAPPAMLLRGPGAAKRGKAARAAATTNVATVTAEKMVDGDGDGDDGEFIFELVDPVADGSS